MQELLDPVESLVLLPLKNEILYLSDMIESLPYVEPAQSAQDKGKGQVFAPIKVEQMEAEIP